MKKKTISSYDLTPVWELPGGLGVQPPSSFLQPPSLIY